MSNSRIAARKTGQLCVFCLASDDEEIYCANLVKQNLTWSSAFMYLLY